MQSHFCVKPNFSYVEVRLCCSCVGVLTIFSWVFMSVCVAGLIKNKAKLSILAEMEIRFDQTAPLV